MWAARVPLSDLIELQADRRFLLHGRHADLINIAGKRTSLAYLNHQLLRHRWRGRRCVLHARRAR